MHKSINHYTIHLCGIISGYMLVFKIINVCDSMYWVICFYLNVLFLCIRDIEVTMRDTLLEHQGQQQRQQGQRRHNNGNNNNNDNQRYESVMLDDNDDFGRWYDRERERRERESFLGGDNNSNDHNNNNDNHSNDHNDNINDIEEGHVQEDNNDGTDLQLIRSHWDIIHTEIPL